MIVDEIPLSGDRAYLRDAHNQSNLVNADERTGTFRTQWTETDGGLVFKPGVAESEMIIVSGVELQIERDEDLLPLFSRHQDPLLSVRISKEIFPGLRKDPYCHRVHTIGGFDDFNRGALSNLRTMEIEQVPTLVSIEAGEASWRSPRYEFAVPFRLTAAAWDLAVSKLAPSGFTYDLKLLVWKKGDNNPTELLMCDQAQPGDKRFKDGFEPGDIPVAAYQIEFTATVTHDAYMRERYTRDGDAASLGRPLLRRIILLEKVDPVYEFHSLRELVLQSTDYHLFADGATPPRRMLASLALSAVLVAGETITLKVGEGASFKTVEARLDATVRIRPPLTTTQT